MRVTEKILEEGVRTMNSVAGRPEGPNHKPGKFMLQAAWGTYSVALAGAKGFETVFQHDTAKVIHAQITAYIHGYDAAKKEIANAQPAQP